MSRGVGHNDSVKRVDGSERICRSFISPEITSVSVLVLAGKNDSVDTPAPVVRDVERAVGPFRHADGPMLRGSGQRARRICESVGEYLRASRRRPVRSEREEVDSEPLVRQWGTIEPAMKRDERAAAIAIGELLSGVEMQSVG